MLTGRQKVVKARDKAACKPFVELGRVLDLSILERFSVHFLPLHTTWFQT